MLAENACLTSSCFHKVFAGIVQTRGQGGAMGALRRAKDDLTKKRNAKDESFLLICQRTWLFTM